VTPLLQPLAAYLAAHPELTWCPSTEPAAVVTRSAHERWRLQREISDAGAGFGYWRTETLAAQGVAANDVDSREFAQALVDALADHLTPRNLQHLAEAFAAAHARETTTRAGAVLSAAVGTENSSANTV
jgi:hypothetical protein